MKNKVILLFITTFFIVSCSKATVPFEKRISERTKTDYLKKYGDSLSLEEAIQIAKKRNLDLKIKRLEKEIATLKKKISFANFLPSINLFGNYANLDDNISANVDVSTLTSSLGNAFSAMGQSVGTPIAINTGNQIASSLSNTKTMASTLVEKSSYTYGLNAQLPIFVPSYWYLYSARKKGENISKLVESLTNKMIELEITSEFFYVLTLESQQKYLINEVDSMEKLESKAKKSLELEAIMPWEYKKIVVLLKAKKYNLRENERNLKLAKMKLLKSLNLNLLEDIKLEAPKINISSMPKLEDCIYKALSKNEMLKINKIKRNVSKDAKKIAISNFLPKIILNGGYANNSNSLLLSPDFLNLNVSGVVSVFNGFKNVNEYKKATRKEKIANLNLEKEFMKTILETTNAYFLLEKTYEVLEIAKLNLESESEKLSQMKAKLDVEMIGEEEYLSSLASYNEALTSFRSLEFKYNLALGSLNIAMGEKLTNKGDLKL